MPAIRSRNRPLLHRGEPISGPRPDFQTTTLDHNLKRMETAFHLVIRVIRDQVLIVNLPADLSSRCLQRLLREERNLTATRVFRKYFHGIIHEDLLRRFKDAYEHRNEVRSVP